MLGKLFKRTLFIALVLFAVLNGVAAMHAWKFTHFSPGAVLLTRDERKLSLAQKAEALITGVSIPRPVNTVLPAVPFTKVRLQSNVPLDCWMIPAQHAKGTVLLCHGYGACKANMLGEAARYHQFGYNVFLPDFMGAGSSGGDACTIGFHEAEEVRSCARYLYAKGERNIIAAGSSMGAVAIMKAVHDSALPGVRQLILECPYGSLERTVANRMRSMQVPQPFARLLLFWGGLENGFDAFELRPVEYAKSIHCRTLLIWGSGDYRVDRDETDAIFANLPGKKRLLVLPQSGHADYLAHNADQWSSAVQGFLKDRH